MDGGYSKKFNGLEMKNLVDGLGGRNGGDFDAGQIK
jgi:hypothetical protein